MKDKVKDTFLAHVVGHISNCARVSMDKSGERMYAPKTTLLMLVAVASKR